MPATQAQGDVASEGAVGPGGGAEQGGMQGAGDKGIGRGSSERAGGRAAGTQQGSSQERGSKGVQRGVWVVGGPGDAAGGGHSAA